MRPGVEVAGAGGAAGCGLFTLCDENYYICLCTEARSMKIRPVRLVPWMELAREKANSSIPF